MVIYTFGYIGEVIHLIMNFRDLTREDLMLIILELVDVVMILNLVKMIITGSYNSFVDKSHGFTGENISSGMLKVKMSTSLIGVSSIHLLQTFINASAISWDELNKQMLIHGSFLVGSLILAIIDYLHEKAETNAGGHH
jgi:uncharacterized protein (TIGR00645 family)